MRLYFGFTTNIPDTVKDLSTVQVESISFKHKSGDEITVRLWGEADYLVENSEYDARWKGLEFNFDRELLGRNDIKEDDDDDLYITDDDEDIPEEVYNDIITLLKESTPCDIEYYYEEPKYWNIPDNEDFTPTCENMEIALEYGDERYEWKCDKL